MAKADTEVVLQKDYRPRDESIEETYAQGQTVKLPKDEATDLIDNGLALSVEDAAKSEDERRAIRLLTGLGYTVDEPKKGKK